MRILSLLALGLMSTAAMADSELQLKSSSPVQLWIDGEDAGTVQPLEAMRVRITAGVHNLTIKGLMGKELYNRDLIFDDETRTELLWQRKELRLGQVVALEADAGEPEVADDEPAPEVAADLPVHPAPPGPVAAPPAPVAVAPAPPVAAPPVPVAPVVSVSAAPAPPRPAAAPVAASPGRGGVVIQATDTLDLRITHGSQLLRVTVENGELVIRDAQGTQIRFPAQTDAF